MLSQALFQVINLEQYYQRLWLDFSSLYAYHFAGQKSMMRTPCNLSELANDTNESIDKIKCA